MTRIGRSTNIAGRAGAFSAARWKRATFGWLAFALAAMIVGGVVGSRSLTDSQMASGGAAKAMRMLASGGFNEPATESVLIQSPRRVAARRRPALLRLQGRAAAVVPLRRARLPE